VWPLSAKSAVSGLDWFAVVQAPKLLQLQWTMSIGIGVIIKNVCVSS
jgi:hypothetical protein